MKLIYLFLVILLVTFVKCQPEYSEPVKNVVDKYPAQSDSSVCDFEFVISATVANAYKIELTTTNIVTNPYSYYDSNSSHAFTTTIFPVLNVPIGTYTFTVSSTVDGVGLGELNDYELFYNCVLLDETLLGFATQAIMTNVRPYFNFQYEATIQVIGLKYNQPNLIATFETGGENVDLVTIGNGYYGFNQPLDKIGGTWPNPTNIILQFANNVKHTLVIGSSYNTGFYSYDKFFTFPQTLTQVTEFGYKCSPLVKIYANQTAQYFNPIDFIDTLSNIPVPVYGIGLNITLMVNLPDTYSDGINPETFALYIYDAGFSFQDYTTTITSKKISEFEVISKTSITRANYFVATLVNNLKYEFNDFELGLSRNLARSNWPFGFVLTTPSEFVFNHSFPVNTYIVTAPPFTIKPHLATTTVIIPITFTPQVPDFYVFSGTYDIKHLYGFHYLVTIQSVSLDLLDYIVIDDIIYRNDNITKLEYDDDNVLSTYSLNVDMMKVPFENIALVDGLDNWTTFKVGQFFDVYSYISGPQLNSLDIFKIASITYKYNNIEMIPDQPFSNVLYFNFTGGVPDTNRPFGLLLMDRVSFNPFDTDFNSYQFISKYNDITHLFEIPFIIPANTMNGIIPWSLKYGYNLSYNSTSLSNAKQLNITSYKFDAYGPIFNQINKLVPSDSNIVGFELTIQDDHNGFSYGDIEIRGESDYSLFKFHLTTNQLISGTSKLGLYNVNISLPLNGKCFGQNYIITEVTLVDIGGNIGRFSTVNEIDPISNVFINFLDSPQINIVDSSAYCTNIPDITPPVISTFILVSFVNRVATYVFSATDDESGIRNDQLPIIYLSGNNFQTIQSTSEIISVDSPTVYYRCVIIVPNGFGHPGLLIPSVYGFINHGGYGSGYSYDQLIQYGNIGIQSSIEFNIIEISGSSEFNSYGGQLWIKGRGFKSTQKVYIDYRYAGSSVYGEVPFSSVYPNAFQIDLVQRTNYSIYVYVQDGSEKSNIFKITPTIFEQVNLPPPIGNPSTLEPSPPITPTPSIPRCLGTPECGGSTQGYCNIGKCVCYSPFVGIDCSSKVIIIEKPITNTTDPTIEIPIGGDGSNGGSNSEAIPTDKILYKSLISLVSIRELDFNSQKVVEYPLDKWVYNKVNSTTNEYITNITVVDTTSTTTTTIKATIQWFKDATNITFADQQLSMNPSSVKYTIELTSYKFKTDLNSLQLIMSASFSASKSDDICSVKEFGETSVATGDNNSNYIKVQVGDHSLYGRFIKRGVVDGIVNTIDNVLLDESLNTINSASSVQSFIGINIPKYDTSITIDPDFSVLLDSNDASNNDNSICSSSPSSKLSTAQLAGIIVGSIAFAAIIAISSAYYVIKKKKNSKFLSNMHNKLKVMK